MSEQSLYNLSVQLCRDKKDSHPLKNNYKRSSRSLGLGVYLKITPLNIAAISHVLLAYNNNSIDLAVLDSATMANSGGLSITDSVWYYCVAARGGSCAIRRYKGIAVEQFITSDSFYLSSPGTNQLLGLGIWFGRLPLAILYSNVSGSADGIGFKIYL